MPLYYKGGILITFWQEVQTVFMIWRCSHANKAIVCKQSCMEYVNCDHGLIVKPPELYIYLGGMGWLCLIFNTQHVIGFT